MNNIQDLLKKVEDFPDAPGIYTFHSHGEIVYVGKSLHLRSRVRSYFAEKHERDKLYIMMRFVDDVNYELTDSHLEARLLEFRMIRKLQPMYNAQYKRQRTLFCLQFGGKKVIDFNRSGGFGPFSGSSFLRSMKKHWRHLFPISQDVNQFIFSYQPLSVNLTAEQVEETSQLLELIFTQPNLFEDFYKSIEAAMYEASHGLHFRRAQYFKRVLQDLKYLRIQLFEKKLFFNKSWVMTTDSFYYYIQDGTILSKKSIEDLLGMSGVKKDDPIDVFQKLILAKHRDELIPMDSTWSLEEREIVYSEWKSGVDDWVEINESL